MKTSQETVAARLSFIAARIECFASKGRGPQERSATSAAISNDIARLTLSSKIELTSSERELAEEMHSMIELASQTSANLDALNGLAKFAAARRG